MINLKEKRIRMSNTKSITIEKAGVIAVELSEAIVPTLTAQEQSFFVAGFQECVKYINQL